MFSFVFSGIEALHNSNTWLRPVPAPAVLNSTYDITEVTFTGAANWTYDHDVVWQFWGRAAEGVLSDFAQGAFLLSGLIAAVSG